MVALAPVAIVAAIVGVTALPASAHTATLTGATACYNGDHWVLWGIHNPESGLTMTIDSTDATIGSVHYGASGYSPTVAGNHTTLAATVVPGNVTGSIVLHTTEHWSDGFGPISSTSNPVDLQGPCGSPTTTSTTTSTAPSSTTTSTIGTVTTLGNPTSTTTGASTTTSTAPTTTTSASSSTTSTAPSSTTTSTIGTVTTLGNPTSTTTGSSTTSSSIATDTTLGPTTSTTVGGAGSTVTTAPTPTTKVQSEGSTVTTGSASVPSSVTQTQDTTAASSNSGASLPFTGSDVFGPTAFGISIVAGGLALIYGARRKRRR